MEWIQSYIYATYKPEAEALKVLDDIDKRQAQYKIKNFRLTYLLSRIAIIPPFSGVRRFPEGCNFKQWTGDDSKVLIGKLEFDAARLGTDIFTRCICMLYKGMCRPT